MRKLILLLIGFCLLQSAVAQNPMTVIPQKKRTATSAPPGGDIALTDSVMFYPADYTDPYFSVALSVSNNTNRYLIVAIMCNVNYKAYDSVYYGSQKLSVIDTTYIQFFGLKNPTVGSDSVRCYYTGDDIWRAAYITVWKNVNQTTPYGTPAQTLVGWGTTISQNITSETGGLVVDYCSGYLNLSSFEPTQSQTVIMRDYGNPSKQQFMAISRKAGAATVATGWTINANSTIFEAGIPLKKAE